MVGEEENMAHYVLYTYTIDHLAQKDKVLFYYALKGRDGKGGMLSKPSVIQLGKATVLVPLELSNEFNEFFDLWKCNFGSKDMKIDEREIEKYHEGWE